MVLYILLDSPQKAVYTAGDTVKGQLILKSTNDEAVGSVSIAFQGRAKTKIRLRHPNPYGGRQGTIYRARGSLFWYSKELYRGHYTLRAGQYQWPFEFQFPSHTDPNIENDRFDPSPPFKSNSEVHTLPPTFDYSTYTFTTNFECYTEYKLEATLVRPRESYKFFTSPLEQELVLKYLPRRSTQNPSLRIKSYQECFTAQTLRLLPEKADAKLSMKEKMRATFKKSELPLASFSLEVTFPTQIYPGGPFSLHLGMRHLESSLLEWPPVMLRSVSVEVKTSVFARAPGTVSDHYEDNSWRRQLLSRRDLGVILPAISNEPHDRQPSEWVDLAGFGINTLPLQVDLTTYNIVIFNRLDIDIRVTCADKHFKLKNESHLQVLPPVFAGQTTTSARASIAVANEPLAPPPYEPAPQYCSTEEPLPGW